MQAALGRDYPPGLLTKDEADAIRGPLFGGDFKTQLGANLIRLDAFLAPLAAYAGNGPPTAPPTTWCTILGAEPSARSARAELVSALVIQWLTVQVSVSNGHLPAVIIAGADEITGLHLERLSDACELRGVPLTLLFRHLRDGAVTMIGGGATAFMTLGNHHEAEQAANFIGRNHKFVLSGWTATLGGQHTSTRGTTQTWGNSQSRSYSSTRGWGEDHLLNRSASGSHTRSRDYGSNYSYGTEQSEADGMNWSDATSTQRVYEYTVEPFVLQNLPDNALLLAARPTGTNPQPVECHPSIITLPHVSTTPLRPVPGRPPAATPLPDGQESWPQLEPRRYQPQWPLPAADDQPGRPASWRRGSHRL